MSPFRLLLALLLAVAAPGRAGAVHVQLKLEPGGAVPLTDPQQSRFGFGGGGMLKLGLDLAGALEIQIGGGYLAFPATTAAPSTSPGTAITAGGGLRLKRPHDSPGVLYPWIDADALYVRTGDLDRFGVAAGVGLSFPIGAARVVWVGPAFRYLFIANSQRPGFDSREAHLLIFGISLEIGTSHRRSDMDRDHDKIPDDDDKCPDQPEDHDGFEDADGCPDPDNDQDGVTDLDDKCPNAAEDRDGFEDADGCPELDNDKDGVPDATDKCPLQPEDRDGFEDEDGCPDPDNDKDGVLDVDDKCPTLPGTKETAGCPDRDQDQTADAIDQCPDVPGPPDNHGCPKYKSIVVTKVKIELNQKIFFAFDKSEILPKSFGLLDEVVQALKDYKDLTVRIEGHTDNKGRAKHNEQLSGGRAESVRQYLIGHGIAQERLTAKGYGPAQPLDSNATAEGREKNRRVEFVITSDGSAQ